ncbi:hypothetical protein B1A_19165 [mine drainage metagenome]|uniref:DinB superfamily protein n=1 Tax=mine drainage metagenome TaxID=410659 RepID=T0YLW2_9ZZZZ
MAGPQTGSWGQGGIQMISNDDFLFFIDQELDAMISMVGELGDGLANRRLAVVGSNSPYAILNHCLGLLEYWGGHVVAGRPSHRDREAEFSARGAVADLIARARVARAQLADDLATVAGSDPPLRPPRLPFAELPIVRTSGGALIHIHAEFARHRGHMDLTKDLLLAP